MVSFILLGIGSFIIGYVVSLKISYYRYIKSQTDWLLYIVSDDQSYVEFLRSIKLLREESKMLEKLESDLDNED